MLFQQEGSRDCHLIQSPCPLETVGFSLYCWVNSRLLTSPAVSHRWPPLSTSSPNARLFEKPYWCFSPASVWEMREMIWINFVSFISASWGIFNYMPCLLWKETIQMPSASSKLFSFFLCLCFCRRKWETERLCFISDLKIFALFTYLKELLEVRADSNCFCEKIICWICTVSACAVLLTAILFAASSSGDVGEPLHIWTHHQQKVCAGNHRGHRLVHIKQGPQTLGPSATFLILPASRCQ